MIRITVTTPHHDRDKHVSSPSLPVLVSLASNVSSLAILADAP
jgi:hypothetical protein